MANQLSVEEAAKYILCLHFKESRKEAIEAFEAQYGKQFAELVKQIVITKFKKDK